jgi:uncharacterized protein (DUF169 family)
MNDFAKLAERLTELLGLSAPLVAVTFDRPDADESAPVPAQPAGCCFWEPAQHRPLATVAADHAHCSVGSYTHGFTTLSEAGDGDDTAALLASGWVAESDLMAAAKLPFRPATITYQPLADAVKPDVVLAKLSPAALMTLLGAVPDLTLARKPQCVIVPLAHSGQVAVSPGCAVSRIRTNLPAGELTCAIPGPDLPSLIQKLEVSTAADRAVSEFASADIARNFADAASI